VNGHKAEFDQKPGIHWLWPTFIWAGRLDLGIDAPILSNDKSWSESISLQSIRDRIKSVVLERLARKIDPDRVRSLRISSERIVNLFPGDVFEPETTQAEMRLILWVAMASEDRSPNGRFGELLLFDPREGCANVSVPGLPLGRALNFPSEVGAIVVFPSLLRWVITPPADGMHQVFYLASLHFSP
jgi:hypothetical protein